jgi:prepilin-type N-terminal cleavage/methylation domain-containing protein
MDNPASTESHQRIRMPMDTSCIRSAICISNGYGDAGAPELPGSGPRVRTLPLSGPRSPRGDRTRRLACRRRAGFTLIELLVVIFIILLVSAVALPTVLPALNHRQVSEAARILQGAIVGARDQAIHNGEPSGIRLLPDPSYPLAWTTAGTIDPTVPLAYNRVVPIGPAPEYSEGAVTVRSGFGYGSRFQNPDGDPKNTGVAVPSLVLEQAPVGAGNAPNSPTSWAWNVRVGDQVQLNNAGPWYTVVGPMWAGPAAGNAELFVNYGAPGTLPTLNPTGNFAIEWLILVNGRDDDQNGFVDDGWDGLDNNGNTAIDEYNVVINGVNWSEWEPEAWIGTIANVPAVNVPYTIRRRPMPSQGAREVALPTSMVVDASTFFGTQERSRLPVNVYNGAVDLMINPDGTVFYSMPYGVPTSISLGGTFFHFWLAERQDVAGPDPNRTAAPYLPLPQGVAAAANITAPQQTLKGEYAIVTLNGRNGQTLTSQSPPFLYGSAGYNSQAGTYNPSNPFIPAEQGVTGGP